MFGGQVIDTIRAKVVRQDATQNRETFKLTHTWSDWQPGANQGNPEIPKSINTHTKQLKAPPETNPDRRKKEKKKKPRQATNPSQGETTHLAFSLLRLVACSVILMLSIIVPQPIKQRPISLAKQSIGPEISPN